MASELYNVIDALSREKGIDPQIVVSAVEDAIVVATRKYYKTQENLRAELDKESGQIRAYAVRTIVEDSEQIEDSNAQITLDEAKRVDPAAEVGGELRTYKATDVLGRIAAQLAKQVIFQKVREAERDTIYNEYIGRVGEVINTTIKRQEGQDVIVDLGKAEGRMPRKEQSRLESFAPGERARAVIVRVEKASKGPQVVVSRAVPELVSHLFQTEVPEIYDNTVVIRAIAREAGERTKIAVMSKDKDVDPVGACVGMKGMRVQSIIRELHGGKIDIKSEEEKRQEVEERMSAVMNQTVTPLESIPDLEPGIVEKLVAAGITTVEAVADMTPEQLEEVPGIGPKTVEKISIAVNNYFSSLEAAEAPAEAIAEEGVATEEATPAEGVAEEEAAAEEIASAEDLPGSEENPLPDDAELEGGGDESATGPDSAGQSGDVEGLSDEAEDSSDSVEDLVESGQYYEAEVVDGIENAPDADVAEVTTHERPETDNENVPEEEKPGEER